MPPLPAEITTSVLTEHVQTLVALHGRGSASDDELAAANYVKKALIASHLSNVTLASFDVAGRKSRNVYAEIPGASAAGDEGPVIVVGAHIDHLGVRGGKEYPGAEDNASGVAVVLEIARVMQRAERRRRATTLFAFFGAEEIGMLGSQYFVQHPPIARSRIRAMVNVDMIGRPLVDQSGLGIPKRLFGIRDKQSVGVLGTEGRPLFRALVQRACTQVGISPVAPEDFPGVVAQALRRVTEGRGDNAPFERVGIPALFFGSGESDDYHLPSDTIDKLDFSIMLARAKAIEAVVEALTESEVIDWAASPLPSAVPGAASGAASTSSSAKGAAL